MITESLLYWIINNQFKSYNTKYVMILMIKDQ